MADIDFKNSVNADSAYVENHKVQLIAIPDGDLELPLSPNDDSGYVVDANGKKHKVMLATFLTSDQDIEYKNGVNANSAYMTVDGQKVKVTLAAKLNGTQRLFDSPNASDAYVEDEDGNEHRTMLVATPEGTLELPTSETYNYAYVVDGDGNKHRVRMFAVLAGGQAYVEVTVKGVSPLSLPDAIADSLSYVKAFGGTEQRNLPDNYIERQFIYMMDGSYLLTDIVPTFAGHYELDMQTTSLTTTATTYLGGRNESSGNGGLRFAHLSDKSFRILGFGNASTLSNTAANNTKYKFIWDNGSFWVYSGTTLIHSETFTEETLPTTTPLAINGWNSGGTITTNTEGIYLYSFKAWNAQGELIANYVPAIQKGTVPVVGFYDTVSKTFKTATAGTFAAGGEAVPTPDAPMDIVSNNGVLKASYNLYNPTTQVDGKYLNDSGTEVNDSAFSYTGYIPVIVGEKYTASFYKTSSGSGTLRIHAYDSSKTWISMIYSRVTSGDAGTTIDGTVTIPSGIAYIRVSWFNDTNSTNKQITKSDDVLPYMPYGQIYTDGTVETINVHGKNLIDKFYIGGASASKAYVKSPLTEITSPYTTSGAFRGLSVVCRVKPNTTYKFSGTTSGTTYQVATYYDTLEDITDVSKAISTTGFITISTLAIPANAHYVVLSFVTAGATQISWSNLQLELGSTATTYEPYFDGGTATAEMLLKVGDYQDVQSILDGVVTRNVGVKALDGTEDGWYKTNNSFGNTVLFADKKTEKSTLFCSHFQYDEGSTTTIPDMCVGCASTSINTYFRNNSLSTVDDWKQWLKDQYAAGTPVIILYPLATPTTETVTGQTLQVTDGDNVLEITQASLNNLELEATYMAGATLTIQEVQDAQLSPDVEITIQ